MSIKDISIINNPNIKSPKPIQETMNIYIDGIPDYFPIKRNGAHWIIVGSGGSGKTSMLLNVVKKYFKGVFTNIYYFCPSASFLSVKNHPLKNLPTIYHEITVENLTEIYNELIKQKEETNKNKESPEYNLVIIDDMANDLKNESIKKILNNMLIKSRHLQTMFIFSLQALVYLPKTLRRQITYFTIFKCKKNEWQHILEELVHYKPDDANKLYNFCFNEPYNHIDMDLISSRFYLNFHELNIKE